MQDLIRNLVVRNDTKIVLLVMDGLGGLPRANGLTEMEAASTPNLDALARESACGLHSPVGMGITPGSGPGHLGLFGYDPLEFQIGRGLLEALGLGMEVRDTDIALRCNYSTVVDGIVTDRRAERIPTDESRALTEKLQAAIGKADEAEILFAPGMEHRFAVIMRFAEPLAPGSDAINDTDPQVTGKAPLMPVASTEAAEKVARAASELLERASEVLKGRERANHLLMRGFAQKPAMPTFADTYGLKALAIAAYPMYRGVARLVGMEASERGGNIAEEVALLKTRFDEFDFFFVHVKKVDSYGEDGDFEAKAAKIEEVDRALPDILALKPDVLIVTGDHSTPCVLKSHSWHPVPVLIKSPYVFGGLADAFSERQCARGELGVFPTVNLMPMALANSLRLKKFGA